MTCGGWLDSASLSRASSTDEIRWRLHVQQGSGDDIREHATAVEQDLLDARSVREAFAALVEDLGLASSQDAHMLRRRAELAALDFARLFT